MLNTTVTEVNTRGIRPIGAEVMEVTPAIAERWLQEDNYEHQRMLRPYKVTEYAVDMIDGKFTHGHISFAVTDGKYRLVNGQHTLNAIIEGQVTITCTVESFHAPTMEDVAVLYSTFDSQAVRTFSDQIEPFGVIESTGLTRTQINALKSALLYIHAEFKGWRKNVNVKKLSAQEIASMIELYTVPSQLYFSMMKHLPRKLNRVTSRAGVLAVVLETIRYAKDPNAVLEFWKKVITGDNVGIGSIEYTLGSFIREGYGKDISLDVVSRRVAHGWNLHCQGRDSTYLRLGAERYREPIRILNTPWNGVK